MNGSGKDNWCQLALILAILSLCVSAEKQKRQIFREQVLPALGGKIPEEAFRTDRLALNRLNKEGISVPDGVVFDARHVQKHPRTSQHRPKIIKVYLTPDGRYVPPEGRTHYDHPKAVDTTYIIRTPFGQPEKPANNYINHKHHRGYNVMQQSYNNYRQQQVVPLIPPTKAGVYKPIVTPLTIPGNSDFLNQHYLPGWDFSYDWDTVYRPMNEYYVDNIELFNSHQILTDYQAFLDEFHGRSLRHVPDTKSNDRNNYQTIADRKYNSKSTRTNPQINSYRENKFNVRPITSNIGYTNLTAIPETGFSCRGRKGMFADVETKCQVFYNCSSWSRTSSLCPAGTAFSKEKNRCEWWNTVQCRE